jgi:dTMP kinase
MQNKEGLFLAIEGTDGSGKSTQFKLLDERLRAAGYDVATFKFPRYEEPSSYFVRQYLDGAYGSADEVGPYTASLFYALDRYAAAEQIRAALAQGKVVLVDRYTGSNMAHQGTKFYHADQRRGYFIWLDNLEYEMLRIPRPNVNFVLHVPAQVSQELLTKADKKRDIHETDTDHLKRSIEVFSDMCQLFPKDYMRIDCVRSGELLPIETINNLIWEKITPLLPARPKTKRADAKAESQTAAVVQTTVNPYIEKTEVGFRITQAGRELLKKSLTDSQGSVYAFRNEPNPETTVAAFAHFAEHAGDMHTSFLGAPSPGKAGSVSLHEAVTRDEDIKQLTGLHVVVENASGLLAQKIEQGRSGAYLERPVRFWDYDRKDEHSQYKYFTPEHFKGQVAQNYREYMDTIFDHYAQIVQRLTDYLRGASGVQKAEQDASWQAATRAQACEAAGAALPIAARSTVGMFASAQAIERHVIRLLSDPLPEARDAGHNILDQARQVLPSLLGDTDKPNLGATVIAYRTDTAAAVAQLADNYLPDNHAVGIVEPVTLTSYWPRNEIDLVPDMLYEHSNLPLAELRSVVDKWAYQQKAEVFQVYAGERQNRNARPGRALEKAHYSWDIVCDYDTFRELMKYRLVDDLEHQELTPRYGYEVPDLIEDAGLADTFEACFDISLKLHSILQAAGFREESQYAVLRGHRLRWKLTYNAREAFHIHETAVPTRQKLVRQMHEKLAEIHPLLAEAMRFARKA